MPPLSIKDLRDSSPDESSDRTEDKPAGSSPPQQFYQDNEAAVEAIIGKRSSRPVMAGGVPERSTELPLPRFWSVAIRSGNARQRTIQCSTEELADIENPLVGTFVRRATRDRSVLDPLPAAIKVQSAFRNENA